MSYAGWPASFLLVKQLLFIRKQQRFITKKEKELVVGLSVGEQLVFAGGQVVSQVFIKYIFCKRNPGRRCAASYVNDCCSAYPQLGHLGPE